MKITVAICTWNRSELLKQTLERFLQLKVPKDLQWEIVIVDNNSTDDTQQVIEQFTKNLPVVYVFEAQQGHSVSRNTAIANASGTHIIWTDNDVLVSPNWLAAYAEGFSKHPDVSFFGGQIDPVFETAKPKWLAEMWEKCKAAFATRNLGDQEVELNAERLPYGANFAIKTAVQKEFRYDTQFGRKASGMLGDDEIAVLQRVANAGHKGVWLPKAGLQHFVPNDRITERYVIDYFICQGQTNVMKRKRLPATAHYCRH